jgi:hypothetical protein
MSDILDYIRAKLMERPLTPDSVNDAILSARLEYGGDSPYVRRPKIRDVIGASRDLPKKRPMARRCAP